MRISRTAAFAIERERKSIIKSDLEQPLLDGLCSLRRVFLGKALVQGNADCWSIWFEVIG